MKILHDFCNALLCNLESQYVLFFVPLTGSIKFFKSVVSP